MTTEVALLGAIAASTIVMAVVQITVVVVASRAARDAAKAAQELRQQIQPILIRAREISEDAAHVTALARRQVERVDVFMATVTSRVDETLATVQDAVAGPARQGAAFFTALRAVVSFFRAQQRARGYARDDEDALFIG